MTKKDSVAPRSASTQGERLLGKLLDRRSFLKAVGVGAALVTVPLTACAQTNSTYVQRRPPSGPDADFHTGVGAHFGQRKGYLPANLELMKQAGVTSLRDEIYWADVEREKGVLRVPEEFDTYVREAAAAGIDPLLILAYSNPFYDDYDRPTSEEGIAGFVRYATFMAEHFRGVVDKFEVWNEWDIPIGGGNITEAGEPEDYLSLLKEVYPALKEVDPDLTVLAGAMISGSITSGYFDAMLDGGLLNNCDGVSLHTYNFSEPEENRRPEDWLDLVEVAGSKMRARYGGNDFPGYVTEMGWPTSTNFQGMSQERSAAHCARMYALARTLPWLKGLWWYDFQDDLWDDEDIQGNFGLVRPDLTPKESYHAYSAMSGLVATGEYQERLDAGDPNIWALKFSSPRGGARAAGKHVLVLWSAYVDDDWQVVLKNRGRLRPVTLEVVGRSPVERAWGRRLWYEDGGAEPIPNELSVTVRRNPVLIKGDLEGLSVQEIIEREFPEAEVGGRGSGPG